MSFIMSRFTKTAHMDFRADERAKLVAWADKYAVEASIQPADGEQQNRLIFVGYGKGVTHWTIYQADGHLWLCSIGDRTEQGREGSKVAVQLVADALAKILLDSET